jgi:hypothetical protein
VPTISKHRRWHGEGTPYAQDESINVIASSINVIASEAEQSSFCEAATKAGLLPPSPCGLRRTQSSQALLAMTVREFRFNFKQQMYIRILAARRFAARILRDTAISQSATGSPHKLT